MKTGRAFGFIVCAVIAALVLALAACDDGGSGGDSGGGGTTPASLNGTTWRGTYLGVTLTYTFTATEVTLIRSTGNRSRGTYTYSNPNLGFTLTEYSLDDGNTWIEEGDEAQVPWTGTVSGNTMTLTSSGGTLTLTKL